MAGQQQEAGDALAASEAKCPICLEDTGAPTAGPDSVEVGGVQQVQRCGVCQTTFHRACACTTVMAAVEEGGPLRLPMRCPVPGCSAEWPVELIAWALDEGQLMRYHTACGAAEELRSAAAGCSGSDAPPPDSPRTVETLRRLGGITTCLLRVRSAMCRTESGNGDARRAILPAVSLSDPEAGSLSPFAVRCPVLTYARPVPGRGVAHRLRQDDM
eukprot:1828160-Rhodomonas_salina.1